MLLLHTLSNDIANCLATAGGLFYLIKSQTMEIQFADKDEAVNTQIIVKDILMALDKQKLKNEIPLLFLENIFDKATQEVKQ